MHFIRKKKNMKQIKENIDNTISDWMNNPDADTKDIVYKGDLKKRLF